MTKYTINCLLEQKQTTTAAALDLNIPTKLKCGLGFNGKFIRLNKVLIMQPLVSVYRKQPCHFHDPSVLKEL